MHKEIAPSRHGPGNIGKTHLHRFGDKLTEGWRMASNTGKNHKQTIFEVSCSPFCPPAYFSIMIAVFAVLLRSSCQ
jgi:hypothetical protein